MTSETEGTLVLSVDGIELDIAWEDNESVQALLALAEEGEVVVSAQPHGGFEQVGDLFWEIPRQALRYPQNHNRLSVKSNHIGIPPDAICVRGYVSLPVLLDYIMESDEIKGYSHKAWLV